MKKILKNIFYLFFPLLLGSLIGLIISKYMDYTTLKLPPLAPPKVLFPIMWSIIYLLIGISYFIYKKKENYFNIIDITYYIQLVFNLLWSIIFFVFKYRFLAILWIIIIDLQVILLIYLFTKKSKVSAYLNAPYLLWCLFATYLTIGIYILN